MLGQRRPVALAVRPRAVQAWRRHRAAVPVLVYAGAGVLLFLAYLGESRALPVNSDGAGNALQAWDMLHGNLLLHGWFLTDVSFYTTELPQYMLVELARGLSADVVHVAAAMTYTLLVLLAALLARGRAAGREAAARMLLAGGIMLAPTLGLDANVLLLSPDHTGTMVPLLVMWLILALATVADTVTLLEGMVPVIVVCLLRLLRDRHHCQSRRFELALAGSAAASAAVAWLAVSLIRRSDGFVVHRVTSRLVTFGALWQHAANTAKGLLVIFGSDFFGGRWEPNPGFLGAHPGPGAATSALHLVGVTLAAWALCIAVRRWYREREFVVAALAVGVTAVVAAYLFSGFSGSFIKLREMSGVLPMTAVLAGRLLPARLAAGTRARAAGDGPRPGRRGVRRLGAAGLATVMLLAGAGYAANLGYSATRRPVPAQYRLVADWLARHHLSYGFGGYWQADSISLESRGRIRVRVVRLHGAQAAGGQWESQQTWYDPRLHNADFVVVSRGKGGLRLAAVTAAFGPPAHVYGVAGSMVLTWQENLLTDVAGHPPRAGRASGADQASSVPARPFMCPLCYIVVTRPLPEGSGFSGHLRGPKDKPCPQHVDRRFHVRMSLIRACEAAEFCLGDAVFRGDVSAPCGTGRSA